MCLPPTQPPWSLQPNWPVLPNQSQPFAVYRHFGFAITAAFEEIVSYKGALVDKGLTPATRELILRGTSSRNGCRGMTSCQSTSQADKSYCLANPPHTLASDYAPEPGIKRVSHTIAREIKGQDHQHDTKTWCEGKYGIGQ
jgi:hypothetical protein